MTERANQLLRVVAWWLPVCLALAGTARAQYRFDNWTTENGLPQNTVNRILQTRDGFLWLATFGGLVRYDGANFHVFNTVNTKGLRSSRFINLFEDQDGNLWATTEAQGLARYQGGVFTSYTTADGLPHNRVHQFFYDAEGQLLIDTDKGVVQWRQARFLPYEPYVPHWGEAGKAILSRTTAGVVWYSDQTGLHKFEQGRVTQNLSTGLNVKRLFEDGQGRLWIEAEQGTQRILVSFKDGQFTTYDEQDGIPPFRTVFYSEDRQGNIWFGLRGEGGLLRFRDGKFTRYTMADGFPSNNIAAPYQDREGTLWVATEGGLVRLTERVMTAYSSQEGLAADNTYPIYQDRQGRIWIGCWHGLTLYQDGVFTRVSEQYGVAQQDVVSILEDREGGLWLGTWGAGVKRVKDGSVTSFPREQPPGAVVRAIYQDRAGDIWFGGLKGVTKYRDGVFTPITARDGFADTQAFIFYEDRQDNLWIGTDLGLTKYRDGVFTNYGAKEGLAGNVVRAIYEDRDGGLWLGTYDSGLFRFKHGKFTRYTTQEGLFDNGAFQIIEDKRGNFWLSCNVGIYRVARQQLDDFAEGRAKSITAVPYGKRDGMLSAECNGGAQPSGIMAADGRIWFPTQKGVVIIDPEAIQPNLLPPPVAIEEFVIDHQSVPLRDRIELLPGQTDLEIHYAGLTFIRPELTKFKYKLEGLDADWIEAGQRRIAYYTHIPFGSYRFRVSAANRDGVWNEQGATVQVVVAPPFWRTGWFLALAVLSAVALGVLFYRWRISLLKREHAVRESFARQLIESQEHERKRIAAGLHDGLSQSLIVIKNWALLGMSTLPEPEPARQKLLEISSTASQALNEVREIAYNLGPYQLDRLGLTQTILEMVERVSSASALRFATEVAEVDGLLSKEAEINLFRVIQEALNNIVKHAAATEVKLIVQPDTDWLLVTIQDNGKGFIHDVTTAPTPRKQGFGLFGMAERVRMTGGTLAVNSAPGQGTSINLKLPYGQVS